MKATFALIILILASSALADVIHVPVDQPTIQDGIRAAEDFDTVLVAPGTYEEGISFQSKQIKVMSSHGYRMTTLIPYLLYNGGIEMNRCPGGFTEFSGFTVTGAVNSYTLLIMNSGEPIITDNLFYRNNLAGGMGIACGASRPIIERNIFVENGGSACVYTEQNEHTIANNTFVNNAYGVVSYEDQPTLKNNIFVNCSAEAVSGYFKTADYNCFWRNATDYGPGAEAGPNDINADPLFISMASGWYHLSQGSPCIDAGDPDQLFNDPDGSRNDIGALYFQGEAPIVYAIELMDEDLGHVIAANPTFSWSVFSLTGDQAAYEIEVGSDSDWTAAEMWSSGVVVGTEELAVYGGTPLIDGETYWIRMRVDDGRNWGGWADFRFRTNSAPIAPVSAWPPSSTPISSDGTRLVVNNAFDAEGDVSLYDFELFTDTLVYDTIHAEQGAIQGEVQTQSSWIGPLETSYTYYWRARANDGYEYSPWSPWSIFTTRGPSTIFVPQDLATIQGAIDVAGDDDTIVVGWGAYHENIDFSGKRIILKSLVGPVATKIVAADSSRSVISFVSGEPNGTEVSGFTITGSNTFGLHADGASVRIIGNVIKENPGGGMHLTNSSGSIIRDNVFVDNVPTYGSSSALRFLGSSHDTVASNLFYSNGGLFDGILVQGTIEDLQVRNNTIYKPAQHGIRMSGAGTVHATNNIISGATGWGMYLSGGGSLIADYNCTYSNALGDYTFGLGVGNVFSDPEFVDAENADFSLGRYSPCIDAGDPEFLDEDGSRPEIGAVKTVHMLPVPQYLNMGNQNLSAVLVENPTLYWSFLDSAGGQLGYEIQVGTDDDWSSVEMWSTGAVASADTQAVYDGSPLADHALYYVRLRVQGVTGWGSWRYMRFTSHLSTLLHVPNEFSYIQEAIGYALDGDTILVGVGVYTESIDYSGKTIVVTSEHGAEFTILRPAEHGVPIVTIANGEREGTALIGFTIENGRYANTVLVEEGSNPTIAYNVFRYNEPANTYSTAVLKLVSASDVHHNLFYQNEGFVSVWSDDFSTLTNNTIVGGNWGIVCNHFKSTVINNIVVNNRGRGIYGSYALFEYNNAWGNDTFNVGGLHGFSLDPLFIDAATHDYRLKETSPCIDAGHPGTAYYDSDGSRSDMGALPYTHQLPIAHELNLNTDDTAHILSSTPTFYWNFLDSVGNQQKYQVEVGTDADWVTAEMWASGEISSSDTEVVYQGLALEDKTSYHVRARVAGDYGWGGWRWMSFSTHLRKVVRVPEHQPTIQAGIDFALDGDTVLVAPGLYEESLDFLGKQLVLMGEKGADSTTFYRPPGQNDGIVMNSDDSIRMELTGFTISGVPSRHLVLAKGSVTAEIHHNVFTDHVQLNHWTDPTTVSCEAAMVDLHHNLFHNNRNSGCIVIRSGAARITNNTLDNNDFAIYRIGGDVEVRNNSITNTANWGCRGYFTYWDYNNVFENDRDYWGQDPGASDISVDPGFVDPVNGVYHLTSTSLCIDAGDPDTLYRDSDGTRGDIGAFAFEHAHPLALQIYFGPDTSSHITNTTTPDIFWTYLDSTGSTQSHYEIEVGDDNDWTVAEMWDDGPIASTDTHVVYAGNTLLNHRFYQVRVRLANANGWGDWRYSFFRPHSTQVIAVPGDRPTITSGIVFALPGDTILVGPGVYEEPALVIDKHLVLLAEGGREVTTITDSGAAVSMIKFVGVLDSTTILDGFTISNSTGRGIECQTGASPIIRNCDISYCVSASHGAGIWLFGSSAFVRDNRIHHNAITPYTMPHGGAIAVAGHAGTRIEITGNQIYENYAHLSPGVSVYIVWESNPGHLIARNVIWGNKGSTPWDHEGAIHYQGGQGIIVNNTIVDNSEGITMAYERNTIVANNIIAYNLMHGLNGRNATRMYNCFWQNGNNDDVNPSYDIVADPMLADTANHDYTLLPGSPCIDAGHPASEYADPDGSRNDIGAFYTNHILPLALDIRLIREDSTHVLDTIPTITWKYHDTTGAAQSDYEIAVGSDNDWSVAEMWESGPVTSGDSARLYDGSPLLPGADYFLRLKVRDSVGWGDWQYRSFHMNSPPTVVTPDIPIDGDTIHVSYVHLRVDWIWGAGDPDGDTMFTDWEVYQDSALTELVWSEYDFLRHYTDHLDLEIDKQYWWRVRSHDKYFYNDWSEVRSFHVRGSNVRRVPSEYASIKAAVDSSVYYDTVLVAPGTYYENIEIHLPTRITILSEKGSDSTFLRPLAPDAPILYAMAYHEGSSITIGISGFTFENCSRFSAINAGIFYSGPMALLHLSENVFRFNNSNEGEGYFYPAVVVMSGGSIRNNLFYGNGSLAVYCNKGTLVSQNTFVNNHASLHLASSYWYNDPRAYSNIVINSDSSGIGGYTPDSKCNFNLLWNNGSNNDGGPHGVNADPQFIDAEAHDYRLQSGSPCIDAGHSDVYYNDPDGTRSDIGAIYYHQEVASTNAWVNVYCEQPLLDDQLFLPGQSVQVYDPDGVLCGMGNVAEDGSYGFIPVYRDDPYTEIDEGAEPGDDLTFKIHGVRTETDSPVSWTANGDRIEACHFLSERCYQIALNEGWNLVSWNVTHDESISALAQQLGNCLDVVLGFDGQGQTYDPTLPGFSTLQSVDYQHGYWIRLSCDASFTVCGLSIPSQEFIPVHAGWNLVAYWPEETLPVEDALATVLDDMEVAYGFDQELQVFIPDDPVHSDLTEMAPNFGYWLKSSAEATLSYPGQIASGRIPTRPLTVAVGDVTPSRTWMSIYGAAIQLDGQRLRDGVLIEVATQDGTTCGQGVYSDGILMLSPIYGRDPVDVLTSGYPVEGDSVQLLIDGRETLSRLPWEANARVKLEHLTSSETGSMPTTFALHQNHPNPFNSQTTIEYDLPKTSNVEIVIYNIAGQRVNNLVNGEQPAGFHQATWDGTNAQGKAVASGVYFYRIKAEGFTQSKKMVLLK